jgi:DNA-binding MarR family transcriptional regulator
LYDTTPKRTSGAFPDDELARMLRALVRSGGLLEPHDHAGLRLSVSEVFALGELAEAGPLSQQELAARLGLEKSTVSRLAAALEQRGWLSRERDPANRRLYRLTLTDGGRTAADRVGEHLRARHRQLLDGLTPAERAGLALGLTALARVLEAPSGEGSPEP